jgi:succinate dehydrogenase/fumarate reductase flavoprotein subunit
MWPFEELKCDVLILGGGGAACMAAIAAHQEGARVLLIDKGQLGKSGCSPNAHGGIAAFHKDPEDNWRVQMHDTLLSGGFLNDQEVLEIMCTGPGRFLTQLEEFATSVDTVTPGVRSAETKRVTK